MKKIICAAVVAGSMCAMAAEAVKTPVAPEAAPAVAAKPALAQAKITDEQRAKMREQREKFIAERRAAIEAKMLVVVKKYGLDDEKGKALIKELMEAMRPAGRPMMRRPMSDAPKAPEAK